MPLRLALAARETVAGRRLGALGGGGITQGVSPPLPLHPCPSPPPPRRQDAIVGFAYENNQNNYRHNMAFTADLLGNTVTEVGYHLSIKRTKEDLMFAHRLLVGTLDDEFRVSSLSRVELAARQAGTWILSLWAALGEAAVVALVDNMNRRLQKPGNEIVMGRWRDATNASIAFLTQFRFTSACLGGVCGSDPTAAAPMKAALAGGSGSLLGNDYRPHTVFAGYTYLPFARAGLVYKIDVEQLQQEFVAQLKHIVDDGNQHQEGSTELVLGHRSPEVCCVVCVRARNTRARVRGQGQLLAREGTYDAKDVACLMRGAVAEERWKHNPWAEVCRLYLVGWQGKTLGKT